VNLTETPTCECGTADEDAHHYLLECPNYSDLREELKDRLNFIEVLNSDHLLYGKKDISFIRNVFIFKAVHNYMERTMRFT